MPKTHLCSKKTWDLSQILGEPKTRKEVLAEIESNPVAKQYFEKLPDAIKGELIAFCMGNRGLKITYDPFFKYIFNPSMRPERLSDLLSLIFEEEVEVVEAIPNESPRISDAGTLLITDIVVRLRDGSYANVEIQKIGYQFPGQRCACYSSDLLQRQIIRAKNIAKKERRKFAFGDLKKVYTIVLIEESSPIYWQHPNDYIHRGKQTFDTGLELDLLQEFIIIPLDVFRKITHNEISKLEAWLYFIGSDDPEDICRIVDAYPEFKELYNELIGLRYDLGELTDMYDHFRQLLREMDEDTIQYMVEEQKKQIEENEKLIEEQKEMLGEQERQLGEQERQLGEQERQLGEQERQLGEQERQLGEQERQLEDKERTIAQLLAENEKLKAMISQ